MSNSNTNSDGAHEIADDTLELITTARNELQLNPEHRRAVLVFGRPNHGKKTLMKFITQKPLTAYLVGNRHAISDVETTSSSRTSSTVISNTLMPQMHVNEQTSTSYCVLQGFTGSPSMQLANAWMTKLVLNHMEQVKFVIVWDYTSLRYAESRTDFTNLLKFLSTLVPSIGSFQYSIALIASKVDFLVPDGVVLLSIVTFLQEAQQALTTIFRDDPALRNNVSSIIDAFLTQENDVYTRIGYFKQPNEAGRLDLQPEYRRCREEIRQIVEENINFTERSEISFHISVSADAIYYTQIVLGALNQRVTDRMISLGNVIEKHFRKLIHSKSGSCSLENLFEELDFLQDDVKEYQNCVTRESLFRKLHKNMKYLRKSSAILKELANLNTIMIFYEELGERTINPRIFEWLEPVKRSLHNVETNAKRVAELFNNKMEKKLQKIVDSIGKEFSSYTKDYQDLDEGNRLLTEATDDFKIVQKLTKSLKAAKTFNKFVGHVNSSREQLSFDLPSKISDLEEQPDDFPFTLIPQLKIEAWRQIIVELENRTSKDLQSFKAELETAKYEKRIKSLKTKLHTVVSQVEELKENSKKEKLKLKAEVRKEMEDNAQRMKKLKKSIKSKDEEMKVMRDEMSEIVKKMKNLRSSSISGSSSDDSEEDSEDGENDSEEGSEDGENDSDSTETTSDSD